MIGTGGEDPTLGAWVRDDAGDSLMTGRGWVIATPSRLAKPIIAVIPACCFPAKLRSVVSVEPFMAA